MGERPVCWIDWGFVWVKRLPAFCVSMEEVDVKVVILGCTDVGKTSITMRYCHNSFTTPTSATIGASFLQKRLNLIWDTAGQERFRSMAPMYYRNAKAAILVFDLTQESTFTKLKDWLHDLQRHVDGNLVLAVVGNKYDAPNAMDIQVAKDFSQKIGATLHFTSAKTGEGVEEVFVDISKRLAQQQHVKTSHVSLEDPPSEKKCCF